MKKQSGDDGGGAHPATPPRLLFVTDSVVFLDSAPRWWQ